MAGGIGGAGGASGGLGSVGAFSASTAASTPTDFSAARSEPDAGAASSSSANAQVSTGFDAAASASSMDALGGADVNLWKPQRPDEQEQPAAAATMQPSDDVLAQVCAAYSANQM